MTLEYMSFYEFFMGSLLIYMGYLLICLDSLLICLDSLLICVGYLLVRWLIEPFLALIFSFYLILR